MNIIKKCLMCLMLCFSIASYAEIVDTYDVKLSLQVPRVFNNSLSQGYRRYQSQKLVGKLVVRYDDDNACYSIELGELVNQTHKVNGQKVTYKCMPNEDFYHSFVYVGSNAKDKFVTTGISFAAIADPSYNIGDVEEDNTLVMYFSGTGTSSTKIVKGSRVPLHLKGYVAGNLGCGCSAYGHKSPTRLVGATGPTSIVEDVAPIKGIWKARFSHRAVEK